MRGFSDSVFRVCRVLWQSRIQVLLNVWEDTDVLTNGDCEFNSHVPLANAFANL